MAVSSVCKQCGDLLPKDAPAGLCPACLLAAAFVLPEPDPRLERFKSPTTPGPARFVPPAPAFAERFNREARTLARLSHPHIVAVHDFGEASAGDEGTAHTSPPVFYFLMEYVDGANLWQLMGAVLCLVRDWVQRGRRNQKDST